MTYSRQTRRARYRALAGRRPPILVDWRMACLVAFAVAMGLMMLAFLGFLTLSIFWPELWGIRCDVW